MTLATWWNRSRWRLYAPVYDVAAKPFASSRIRAIDQLDPRPDDRILVVGCGTGLDLAYLPEEAAIAAIDIVPENVRRTEARADSLGLAVGARVGDAQSLPYEDDAFDAVLLHLVLTVVPDPEAVVGEVDRVLAPGGRASIFDKFVPEGTTPSLPRRAINPVARLLFSDVTRRLEPMLADTELEIASRETLLADLYTVAIASPSIDD